MLHNFWITQLFSELRSTIIKSGTLESHVKDNLPKQKIIGHSPVPPPITFVELR